MMGAKYVVAIILVLALAATDVSKASLEGYMVNSSSNSVVYSIDFDTCEQIPLGPSGINHLSALEFSPIDGSLFGLNFSYESFYRIDSSTGLGTLVKSNLFQGIGGCLAFSVDGTLYGLGFGTGRNNLFTIDTNTGDTTLIGSLGPYIAPRAFAIDTDGKGIGWDEGADWLFEIDLTDGSTSSIGPLSDSFHAFDYGPDGVLYGWFGNNLYSIDVDNLTATHLQSFSVYGDSFAVIPEPATLTLLLLGGLGLARKRRR